MWLFTVFQGFIRFATIVNGFRCDFHSWLRGWGLDPSRPKRKSAKCPTSYPHTVHVGPTLTNP